jgi:Protein of unknown function (DUF2911)
MTTVGTQHQRWISRASAGLTRAAACCALGVPLMLIPEAGAAQSPVLSRGSFITRLGNDTVAVESFERTATSLRLDIVYRSPSFRATRYTLQLNAEGRPTQAEAVNRTPAIMGSAASRPTIVRARFGTDSIDIELQGDSIVRRRIAGVRAIPTAPYSFALLELETSRLPRTWRDSVITAATAISPGSVSRTGRRVWLAGTGDTVRVLNYAAVGTMFVVRDSVGRIRGADGRQSTSRILVTRLDTVLNVERLAEQFARAEMSGRSFGSVIATRDTLRATVGSASVMVDYSGPKVRGRKIFVGGVLGDTLWRTGANAATQLTISEPLRIGGHLLSAGTYSLYTAVDTQNRRYELVINAQTGQWGTSYDRSKDITRVPWSGAETALTETLTFSLEPRGSREGLLRLSWENLTLSVTVEQPARAERLAHVADSLLAIPRDRPGVATAVVLGRADAAGEPFAMILRIDAGAWFPPHTHNVVKRLEVLRGTMRVGHGSRIDTTTTAIARTGSVLTMPADHAHYEGASETAVVLLEAIGPFRTTFVAANR